MDVLMEKTKPEFVAFEMDVFWVVHPGADPVKYLAKYPGRWQLMHIKDMLKTARVGTFTGKAPHEEGVVVGTGRMDWKAILKAASASGVKHYFIEDEHPNAVNQIPQSLNGWYLTDSDANLTKWAFPDVTIGGDGYLVVFASSKNRAVAGAPLHTNFSLGAGGEYLGLVEPDGATVASEYAPEFPTQVADVSYGTSEDVINTQFLTSGATGKLLVPTSDIGNGWTATGYDDST